MSRLETRYREAQGRPLDFSRAWWTPPLAPRDAWQLETNQISSLGYQPLISLTDHDNVDAPLSLRILQVCRKLPVSVEWTLPVGGTQLHVGLHNLPPETARTFMKRLASYTKQQPHSEGPVELLSTVGDTPGTLIVLNHPLWDELGVGESSHRAAALSVLKQCRRCFHAIEWNGLRPWRENREVAALARDFMLPVVSGGDRHGLEPNTVLNLTNAVSFSEFAQEVRDGFSHVLITDRYCEAHQFRMLQTVADVLRDHPEHGRGWVHYSDRIFFRCEDGEVRSLSNLCGDRAPQFVRLAAGALRFANRGPVRHAFRLAFTRRQTVVGS